ncbi:hypothetical protein PsYK624_084210 [Phanerochaete sordida]|uniref:Uncharacterized protein n=1 Tax=Phanerochaete sordida TaxID=48140 RepID=A0A9P3GCS8_9APHY|nr:hypothetical protein PsYK624_084210 [Phanerochaete sordida]
MLEKLNRELATSQAEQRNKVGRDQKPVCICGLLRPGARSTIPSKLRIYTIPSELHRHADDRLTDKATLRDRCVHLMTCI